MRALEALTIAKASSASLRIAATSLSRRRSRIGRTCRQPTEACAYQVPRVSCRSNTSVSVRCSPRGARAGPYSPRRTRPACRILHRHHDVEAGLAQVGDRRWQLRVEHIDHAALLRPFAGKPRSPISSCSRVSRRTFSTWSSSPNSTSSTASRARRARTHRARDGTWRSRARARSWCGRPARPRWRKLHQVLGRIHRGVEAAEMACAHGAPPEQRPQLQLHRRGERERALRADQDVREVEIVAAGHDRRRGCSRRSAAAPWENALDLLGFALPDAAGGRGQGRAAVKSAGASERSGAVGCDAQLVGQHRIDRDDVFRIMP